MRRRQRDVHRHQQKLVRDRVEIAPTMVGPFRRASHPSTASETPAARNSQNAAEELLPQHQPHRRRHGAEPCEGDRVRQVDQRGAQRARQARRQAWPLPPEPARIARRRPLWLFARARQPSA